MKTCKQLKFSELICHIDEFTLLDWNFYQTRMHGLQIMLDIISKYDIRRVFCEVLRHGQIPTQISKTFSKHTQ